MALIAKSRHPCLFFVARYPIFMKMIRLLLLTWLSAVVVQAQPKHPIVQAPLGFTSATADFRASQIADAVLAAVGGEEAWDDTQLIAWSFDGIRRYIWDKWSDNVRIDHLHDDQTVLMNTSSNMGRVFRNGKEILQPDSVAKYVRQDKRNWINESYWLFLPFKLRDPSVLLKYAGSEPTQAGKPADVLLIAFRNGNNLPGGKDKVWVDKKTRLITQWAHYAKLTDQTPVFTIPWDDYQQYGTILLSGDRGDAHEIADIMVFTGLPGEVFSDFTRTDLSRYLQVK